MIAAPAAEPPSAIGDYGLIGDLGTAALVSRTGSIDWLCWPRFDSAACFAALLGTSDHGRWLISPEDPAPRITRSYRDGSVILETVFSTAEGEVALIDFMPLGKEFSSIIRLVCGRRGSVSMRMQLALRFDYGSLVPWVTRLRDTPGMTAIAGPDMVVLHTPVPLEGEDLTTISTFSVSAGQTVPFELTYVPSHLKPSNPLDTQAELEKTEAFWADWSGKAKFAPLVEGPHRQAVKRSLITLKALTYGPTGGIAAAPTTSLPEQLGGPRNWDYRYCWLRDATITLLAFMQAGYYDEAQAWRDWLHRAVAGTPDQLQIMYGLQGERRLTEWEVSWLPGYQGAKPVRVGNAAHDQLQLDVYGEVMDALHQARVGGLASAPDDWSLQGRLLEHLEKIWTQPDEGMWEVRGGRRPFTFSKVMAWVAIDRSIRTAEAYELDAPLDRWRALRTEIHDTVCREGFSTSKNSFTQSFGTQGLDASLLLIPMVGFLPPDDARVRGTLAAVERELLVDGYVLRYRTEEGADGLPAGEGAFLACSFWLADNYAQQGRRREAHDLFDRLLSLRNDLGLLSEEYDPKAGRLVGNFPQAFSHVALISSAYALARDDQEGTRPA